MTAAQEAPVIVGSDHSKTSVVAVCVVPPPVTGMTIATEAFLDEAASRLRVARRTVSRPSAKSSYWNWRVRKYASLAFEALRDWRNERGFVYLVPESGIGLLSTAFLCLITRLQRRTPILHHHVNTYASRWHPLAAVVFRLAGASAIHIVLDESYTDSLVARYRCMSNRRYLVVNNAYAVDMVPVQQLTSGAFLSRDRLTLGFIGNGPEEKGLRDVLNSLNILRSSGFNAELLVAGACHTNLDKELIEEARQVDGVTVLGEIGRAAVRDFFESIDLLVFPSRYTRELQPLVILEALSMGVPVVARNVGVIDGLLGDLGWIADTSEEIAARVKAIRSDRNSSQKARERFLELRDKADISINLLPALLRTSPTGER